MSRRPSDDAYTRNAARTIGIGAQVGGALGTLGQAAGSFLYTPAFEGAAASSVYANGTITFTVGASYGGSLTWEGGALIAGGVGAVGAAGSQVALNGRDMGRFLKAQNQAANDLNNKNCQKFLNKQGINPNDLKQAVKSEVPFNGLKSTISEYDAGVFDASDPLNQTAKAIQYLKNTTVSSVFNDDHNTMGMAQALGHDVYFRPGGLLSTGGISPGNIIHEGLHNRERYVKYRC